MLDLNEDQVRVQFDSADAVSVEAFIDLIHHSLDALKAINRRLSTYGTETLQWLVVDAGHTSPLFATLAAKNISPSGNGMATRNSSAFVVGLGQLTTADACPDEFDSESLEACRKLVSTSLLWGVPCRVSTRRLTVPIVREIGGNAARAIQALELREKQLSEYGTIEGLLRDLRGAKKRDHLVMVDDLTGEEITCVIPAADAKKWDSVIRKAWKHRVAVSGEIPTDSRTGRRLKVVVEDIVIMPQDSDLPDIADIPVINITDGVESSEYIRSLRDGD